MAFKPVSSFMKHELLASAKRSDKGSTITDYDLWFHAMAREGIEAADRDDFVPKDEVTKRFGAMLTIDTPKPATG